MITDEEFVTFVKRNPNVKIVDIFPDIGRYTSVGDEFVTNETTFSKLKGTNRYLGFEVKGFVNVLFEVCGTYVNVWYGNKYGRMSTLHEFNIQTYGKEDLI